MAIYSQVSTFLKKLIFSVIIKILVNQLHSCGFCWTPSQVTALCPLSISFLKKGKSSRTAKLNRSITRGEALVLFSRCSQQSRGRWN